MDLFMPDVYTLAVTLHNVYSESSEVHSALVRLSLAACICFNFFYSKFFSSSWAHWKIIIPSLFAVRWDHICSST